MKNSIWYLWLLLLNTFFSNAFAINSNAFEKKINTIIEPLVDAKIAPSKRYMGVWAGIVMPDGEFQKGFGTIFLSAQEVPSETTIFEIGSITKAFTGILLSKEVIAKKLQLPDLVSGYVPDILSFPMYQNKPIRFVDLATHTSGLPRLPDNLTPKNPIDPYVDYDEAHLYAFLKKYNLKKAPGISYEYSNLGMGSLGHIISIIESQSYKTLIQDWIATPLGLEDTVIILSESQKNRMATGYMNGEPMPAWDWNTHSVLAGAGALKSTGKDMMKFAKANLNLERSELYPALALSHQQQFSLDKDMAVGLGWHILKNKNIVWHNGATFGFSSFMGFDPIKKIAVVLLANSSLEDEKTGEVDSRLDEAALKILEFTTTYLQQSRPN